jgi:hypothetical protein
MAKAVRNTARAAARGAGKALDKVPAPSPNPMTNLILTDLLLRAGGRFLRHTVEGALLQSKYDAKKAKRIVKGRGMTRTLVSTAIARVATSSVPGALIVGGGLLAKTLHDRSQGQRKARVQGEEAVAEQAAAGAEKE